MRILLAHHAPLGTDSAGSQMSVLAPAVQAAGQETRILPIPASHAEFSAGWPSLTPLETGGPSYCDLTSAELATHRQVLRKLLDHEVHQFNPHIIHCQHVWVLAHLALETGVPYLVTAHDAELDALSRDARYSRLAHQAAENAGRILVAAAELAARVAQVFPECKDRILVVEPSEGDRVVEICRTVLRERGVVGGDG
jgi:hypothetical protein